MTRQFRNRRYRIPITAQQVSHRCLRFDLGEAFVLFFADHALLPFSLSPVTTIYGFLALFASAWLTTFCMGSASTHSAFHVTIYFAPSLRRAIGRKSLLEISTRSESLTWPSRWTAICPSRESNQLIKTLEALGCGDLSSQTKVKAPGSNAPPSFHVPVSKTLIGKPCAFACKISSPLPNSSIEKRRCATQSMA